jgi:alcohol dehydrogenase (cytochrome c)
VSNVRTGVRRAALPLFALISAGIFAIPANADAAADGSARVISFTHSQAEKGAELFKAKCSVCHGDTLQGGLAPALAGTGFADRWGGKKVAELFSLISQTMPRSAPGSLSTDDYYSVTAYILSKNGFQTGETALSVETAAIPLTGANMTTATNSARLRWLALESGPLPTLPTAAVISGHPTSSGPTAAELLAPRPGDWPMVNRDYGSQRYSPLSQINTTNAAALEPVCVRQLGVISSFASTPVAYDGVLYVASPDTTWALNGASCEIIWKYDYASDEQPLDSANRGVALYAGALYRTTPTGHLIALDLKTGKLIWDVWLSSVRKGYWLSVAPVVYDGKVFVGEAGSDTGARGHLYAFDSATGKLLWKFNYIPDLGEPGAETWQAGAEHGGGSNWSSYSIDPEKNLTYAPVGNPAPDFLASARPGANLYTDSVVAVNATTGKLDWYAQQTENDSHDRDTADPPVLYGQDGQSFMAVGTKGGWLYIYDRKTHRLLSKVPVSTHLNGDKPPTAEGTYVCPGLEGGVLFNGAAYSPSDRMLFIGSNEWCGTYKSFPTPFEEGSYYAGGAYTYDPESKASGWIRGFDAATGQQKWVYKAKERVYAGATPTAGGVVFSGELKGDFLTLDAKTGKVLYRFATGGPVGAGVSTYTVDGRQYVAVASGSDWPVSGGSPSVLIFSEPKR